jgi:hypothetical protein
MDNLDLYILTEDVSFVNETLEASTGRFEIQHEYSSLHARIQKIDARREVLWKIHHTRGNTAAERKEILKLKDELSGIRKHIYALRKQADKNPLPDQQDTSHITSLFTDLEDSVGATEKSLWQF